MIKLYPTEKFVIKTPFQREEIIKRLLKEVTLNDYVFQKRHPEKPEKLYEGIIEQDKFKICQKHYYGNSNVWKPEIFGKVQDNSIQVELKFYRLTLIIITFFLILGIIGLVNSVYLMFFKNKFDSLLIYLPFILLFIVYPGSYIGFKKAKENEKKFLFNLFK